jgi:hypothetical protein
MFQGHFGLWNSGWKIRERGFGCSNDQDIREVGANYTINSGTRYVLEEADLAVLISHVKISMIDMQAKRMSEPVGIQSSDNDFSAMYRVLRCRSSCGDLVETPYCLWTVSARVWDAFYKVTRSA